MDVEQLMKLIDKVSESDLTGFKYEENGVKYYFIDNEYYFAVRYVAYTNNVANRYDTRQIYVVV